MSAEKLPVYYLERFAIHHCHVAHHKTKYTDISSESSEQRYGEIKWIVMAVGFKNVFTLRLDSN